MTVLPFVTPAARLQCSACGQQTNAACDCGVAYVPAAQRVAEYDKQNPGMSNRSVAKALSVDEKTVRKARKARADMSAPDTVTGDDGKQYPAKKPRSDFEEKRAEAERRGWQLIRAGNGGFKLLRDTQTPELWCGNHLTVIPVALRDVVETLDDIERNPDKYRDITHPQPEPFDEVPLKKRKKTASIEAPKAIDKVAIAEARSKCIADVRAAVDNAVTAMLRNGANGVDLSLLTDALKAIVKDTEDDLEAVVS